MVKLLKQKQFLWISYPDLPVHSEQLPRGKEREGEKKSKNSQNQPINQPKKQTGKQTKREKVQKSNTNYRGY